MLFGSYTGSLQWEAGLFLVNRKNDKIRYRVKGTLDLEFTDKARQQLNPWIVIEHGDSAPADFIGKTFESRLPAPDRPPVIET